MADYQPLEVVGLSPATLHLVTWIGLRFGLGPGRRSGPGLRLGLRCGLPCTCQPGARGSLIAKGARAAHTRASAPDAQRRL